MTNAWATVDRVGGTDPFYAYAVVNDNATNDGSFVATVAKGRRAAHQMLPVAVGTARFSTELVLANPGTEPLSFRVAELAPQVTLQPGEQRFIPNLLSFLGDEIVFPARAVPIRTVSDLPAEFFAGARTFAPAPGGGSYGLFYPAMTVAEGTVYEAWLFGLAQNASVRSNLAVTNVDPETGGPSDGDIPVSLSVDVFDGGTGLLTGSFSTSLHRKSPDWKQFNSILGSFGLENGYARVRSEGPGFPFLVYGVVNDGAAPGRGTSDGSYLSMAVPLPPSPFPP
jgi:hypothetical protein